MKYLEAKHGNLEAVAEINHFDMMLNIRVKDGVTKLNHHYRIDTMIVKEDEFVEAIKCLDEMIQKERDKMSGKLDDYWYCETVTSTPTTLKKRKTRTGEYDYMYEDLYKYVNAKWEEQQAEKKAKRKPKKEDYKEVNGFGEF